jgi:DtxR family Mn-dependent transcriptional regulator
LADANALSPKMEDYLEAVLSIGKERPVVRVRDIAKRLDLRMSTVSGALDALSQAGMIEHEPYEHVELTEAGRKVAERTAHRHQVLFDFLTDILRLDPETAERDACRMEHVVSPETIERLIQFAEFVEQCPMGERERLARLLEFIVRDPDCGEREEVDH